MVSVAYYTDPACPWSWAGEPVVRKLMVQFGASLRWTFVMGGLARDWAQVVGAPSGSGDELVHARLSRLWLRVAEQTGAPIDPQLWAESPIRTSYPACMAVKAAAEQADDGGYRYLRRLREGLMCERRKLDHVEALVEEGRAVGLDVERLRIDLRSHAITEALGADLERTKEASPGAEQGKGGGGRPDEHFSRGAGGTPLPTIVFRGDDEQDRSLFGFRSYETCRSAAVAAGARLINDAPPTAEELVERFGRVTTKEVETVCELPGPRASAELFRLAEQWRVRPLWRMTGYLWERA